MTWPISIALASIMSALVVTFFKVADSSDNLLAAITVYLGAAFAGCLAASVYMYGIHGASLTLSKTAITWMVVAGFAAIGNEMFFVHALNTEMPVGTGKLIYGVGSVLFLIFIGLAFFKETLDATKIVGILVSFIGLYLLLK